jgi:hypothetical protein
MYDDKYYTLDNALDYAKLDKFEFGKYTAYRITHSTASINRCQNRYGANLTEKVFVINENSNRVEIQEKEILPEQIPSIDWAFFLDALYGNKHFISKTWFWNHQGEDVYKCSFQEKEAVRLTEKADKLRQVFGADVVAIDTLSLKVDEEFDTYFTKFGNECNRFPVGKKPLELNLEVPAFFKKMAGLDAEKKTS